MGANLFPLLYKSGIKRDGTKFQGEYCTDGQWVRFQNGAVEKIGGMQALNAFQNKPVGAVIPTIFIAVSTSGENQHFYIAAPNNLYKVAVTPNFQVVLQGGVDYVPIVRTGLPAGNNWLWQFEIVPRAVGAAGASVRTLVVYGCQTAANITQNSQPYLAHVPIESAPFNQPLTSVPIPAQASGGICYAAPYLFFYGANGFVGYSRPADPVALNGAGSGSFTLISGDKVIYGAAIRGGTNSPAVLFWTLSSVVKVVNVGDQQVDFKTDLIFKGSSILSSRSVVEYDSLFFWLGTDRFFIYNGLTSKLKNVINQKYFFDNIDLSKRQLVHGVKHPSKSEIWWYYPEKNQPADVGCTRAIIYNVEENSWYDTAITRDSTYYFTDTGSFFSYGLPIINPDNRYYLWKHEVGDNQSIPAINIGAVLPARNSFIPGFIVTPTISWTAFNPMKQATGVDRWVEIKTIEPDFEIPAGFVNIIINTKEYAQSPLVQSNPFVCFSDTRKIDTNIQGRHMSFTIGSNNYFSMGHVMISLATGDGR